MLKRRACIFAILCLVITSGLITGTWWISGHTPLPADTSFSIIDGRKITLADLGGRPVIVNFWATTCDVCRKELPGLAKLYNEFNSQGLEIINIAMPYDPPNRVLATAKMNNLPFPVALDINGNAVRTFGGIDATPTLFLIDPYGKINSKRVGSFDIVTLANKIRALLTEKEKTSGDGRPATNDV